MPWLIIQLFQNVFIKGEKQIGKSKKITANKNSK